MFGARRHLLTLGWLVVRAAIVGLDAEDWPEFRGPTGQGVSHAGALPVEWSGTNNVAWKQAIPGAGWSSPVIDNGRIYLTTGVATETDGRQTLRALCLDAATGKTAWDNEVFRAPITPGHRKNTQASPTPIVESRRLYVHFGHLGTACLATSGEALWRNTEHNYPPVHGNGGSPVIVTDLLVFNGDGARDPFVVALDKNTGQTRWKVNRSTKATKKFSFSTPLVITVQGKQQIISAGSGAVCAYDPVDGREIWRVCYGEGYSIVPRPVFSQGLLFVSSGFDAPAILAIRPDGTGDVTGSHVAWTTQKGAPNTPSLLAVDDKLFALADRGVLSCFDALTGRLYWQERVAGDCSASPVFADGRIYVQDEKGVGVVLAAARDFRKLAENDLGERTLASYAITDGTIIVRTAGHLYCIRETQTVGQAQ